MRPGNKLFQAEQAAFHYSELSRENISSAMKECIGLVALETSLSKVDALYTGRLSYNSSEQFR